VDILVALEEDVPQEAASGGGEVCWEVQVLQGGKKSRAWGSSPLQLGDMAGLEADNVQFGQLF
jgi:hypothetical protein